MQPDPVCESHRGMAGLQVSPEAVDDSHLPNRHALEHGINTPADAATIPNVFSTLSRDIPTSCVSSPLQEPSANVSCSDEGTIGDEQDWCHRSATCSPPAAPDVSDAEWQNRDAGHKRASKVSSDQVDGLQPRLLLSCCLSATLNIIHRRTALQTRLKSRAQANSLISDWSWTSAALPSTGKEALSVMILKPDHDSQNPIGPCHHDISELGSEVIANQKD